MALSATRNRIVRLSLTVTGLVLLRYRVRVRYKGCKNPRTSGFGHGAQELGEGLEIFREVWSMALSATRNRIIRLNLGVTVATFALTVCIMPASWFGMNIAHGLSVRAPPINPGSSPRRVLLLI